MFRINIKNQGKGLFDNTRIVPGNIAYFFQKSLMADGPDLETVNHRLFFQAILLIRRQRHKKRIVFPIDLPVRYGRNDGQFQVLFMPGV